MHNRAILITYHNELASSEFVDAALAIFVEAMKNEGAERAGFVISDDEATVAHVQKLIVERNKRHKEIEDYKHEVGNWLIAKNPNADGLILSHKDHQGEILVEATRDCFVMSAAQVTPDTQPNYVLTTSVEYEELQTPAPADQPA